MRVKTILPLALLVGCHEGKTPPPWGTPITGGTMLVTRSGSHAVIADPDRDRMVTVDLATREVTADVALTQGDQPGRLVEDGDGRIHVALRGGGAVLTMNVAGEVLARRYACNAPRGIAWDERNDSLHVACATGELVSFRAGSGEAIRTQRLERDLRDVIVQGGNLIITKFKSAEILTVDAATGTISSRVSPPLVQRFGGGFTTSGQGGAMASIAWRTIPLPDGRIVVSHQRQVPGKLETQEEGGYGTMCGGGPVEAAITVHTPGQQPIAVRPIAQGALPVDIAVSKSGDKIAVITAGNKNIRVQSTQVALANRDQNDCRPPDFPDDPNDMDDDSDNDGAPTSIAFTPAGDLVVYFPEKPMLAIHRGGFTQQNPVVVALPGTRGVDAGRAVFHRQTQLGLACASCHPEGHEDGLTWDFAEFGKRRTQNLSGNILERAPYHWSGDTASLPTLMDDVFAKRMSGGVLTERQKRSLGPWLDRIPAPAPAYVGEEAAIERGRELFNSAQTGCVACHSGANLTNNTLVDVGTGGKFKTPSLVGVGARAPFMHDGCAKTLTERFTRCGNSEQHGNTAGLAPNQIADLVTYLESL